MIPSLPRAPQGTPAATDEPAPAPGGGAQSPARARLAVYGMTCAACAAKVERSLNRLPGVRARVNYASERAEVELSSPTPTEVLLRQVERAGYSARALGGRPDPGAEGAQDRLRVRQLRRRLLLAAILFMPLGEWTTAFSLVPWLRFPGWQAVCLALAAPVVVWAAAPFHRAALRAARHRACTMDTLVSLGVIAATGWSVYAMFFLDLPEPGRSGLFVLLHQGGGALYLDVAAGVTTFLLAGRYYEAVNRRRAGDALRSLARLGSSQVAVLAGDELELVRPVEELRVGDRFVVRPGQTIATDGRVVLGQAEIDASSMTGEAAAVPAGVGSEVLGGTQVLSGRLIVVATRVGEDTQLGRMLELVERAQLEKAAVQRLADRVSSVFVPCVMLASGLTFAAWMLLQGSPELAFSAALAVLIIACPCALGLATPAALRVAAGRGAQLGIFFKGHQGLETARQVDTVVLDKTGTVTEGSMRLVGELALDGDRDRLLGVAGALERASEHALAGAVVAAARGRCGPLPEPEQFASLPGLGIEGVVEGEAVVVGRAQLLRQRGIPIPSPLMRQATAWEVEGHTVALVARGGLALGALAVSDRLKPTAREAVEQLRQQGMECVLLTGDSQATARSVAARVGIRTVIAGALPHEKVVALRRLQGEGRVVAMVGDGVNDGPALAASDLGLALGSGTDVAIGAADLVLLRDDLRTVPQAVALARRTARTIRANLVWAFAYNVVAIPLAATGHLDPLVASAAMALSSAFVVWNSARLRRFGVGARDSRPGLGGRALAPEPSRAAVGP